MYLSTAWARDELWQAIASREKSSVDKIVFLNYQLPKTIFRKFFSRKFIKAVGICNQLERTGTLFLVTKPEEIHRHKPVLFLSLMIPGTEMLKIQPPWPNESITAKEKYISVHPCRKMNKGGICYLLQNIVPFFSVFWYENCSKRLLKR